MTIETNFLTSAYLQNRLAGLGNSQAIQNAQTQKVEDVQDNTNFSISSSDNHYLLLKDTVDQYTKQTSLVQISSASLEKVGDYLVEIQGKVTELEASLGNDPLRVQLSSELNTLENELSTFLGSAINNATQKNINISNISKESETNFFNEIAVNGKFTNADAQKLAEIEVNFAHGVAEAITAHNPETCPICAARIAADSSGISQGILESNNGVDSGSNSNPVAHEGATQNSTSVTGASANSTTSNQELDSLMLANKWELSASETLSYSYYQTSGVAYTYNVNASGTGGSTVGTAGPSLIGSADVETRLDLAFADWDSVGAWTFEKVTESGTTVGEIRSRVLKGVGTPSYSAFAYGPGSNPINGDIWYTDGYSTQFDERSFNYYTALHEIGHAVGLSHPFDGGGRGGTTLADGKDFVRNTVMSYTSNDRNYRFVPDSTANPTSISYARIFPTDPGMLDVQVIEHMYGTSTDTNLGDTTYSFADKEFFLKTIVDSGGTDTIDGSAQTEEVHINLNGGTASSIGIWDEDEQAAYWKGLGFNSATANIASVNAAQADGGTYDSPFQKGWYTGVDNLQISKSTTIENAKGGAKADTLIGNASNNEFTGNGGNDAITGGDGDDTAVYSGVKANYTITNAGGGIYTVRDDVGSEGTDTLTTMEFAKFADFTVTLATGASNAIDNSPAFKPDLARAYRPVVRENLSLNVNAFPILAKLNIPQIQAFTRGVADGGFSEIPTAEAKALFTDGLKTEAEIQSALNALDELLKQLSEQQAVLAVAQTNVNTNFAPLLNSQTLTSADFEAAGVSSALVTEVESAGFVAELMTEIRAQIQALVSSKIAAVSNTSENEVLSLLS